MFGENLKLGTFLCIVLLNSISSLLLSRVGNYEIVRSELVLQETIQRRVSELAGYKIWKWRGNHINYMNSGVKKTSKSPLLLIHGLVAPSFHWRDNMPELAKKYDVYALDLLGLGLSDKPLTKNFEYGESLWRDQVLDFIQEVIVKENNMCTENGKRTPCVLAGTGIGGAIALAAATSSVAIENNLIAGLVLLNSQSHFRMPPAALPRNYGDASMIQMLRRDLWHEYRSAVHIFKRYLRLNVYPVHMERADDVLMECIRQQMVHPDAPNIWQNIVETGGKGPEALTDDCLAKLTVPLLLIWGSQDPWLKPPVADRIQMLYPQAVRVDIEAGHCVQDEAPQPVNQAMDIFLQGIEDARVQKLKAKYSKDAAESSNSGEKDTREVGKEVRDRLAWLQEQIRAAETEDDAQMQLFLHLMSIIEKSTQVMVQLAKYGYLLNKYEASADVAVKAGDGLLMAHEGVALAEFGEKILRSTCAPNANRLHVIQNALDYVDRVVKYTGNVLLCVEKIQLIGRNPRAGAEEEDLEEEDESNCIARIDTSLEEMKTILKTGEDLARPLSAGTDDEDSSCSLDDFDLCQEMARCVKVARGLNDHASELLKKLMVSYKVFRQK